MGTRILPIAAAGLLTVSCAGSPTGSSSGSSSGEDGPAQGPSSPASSGSASGSPSASGSASASAQGGVLLAKVRQQGTVPVIARLSVSWTPEASLPDEAARQRQREAIAAAQTALLADLRSYRVRNPRRYTSLPLLAATVDEAALTHLLGSRAVASVQEDSARPFG